jgi:predicted RNA-binding Zn-ribbon protein involved in translation (DUF1610 family)
MASPGAPATPPSKDQARGGAQDRVPARPRDAICEVCYGFMPASELRGCSACCHRYCRLCLNTYWHGAIFSGGHARLTCMSGGCHVAATDEDVAAVVSTRTRAKMRYFRSRDAHAQHPHVRWCTKDGCWHEILHLPAPNATSVACPACGTAVCYKCGGEMGGGGGDGGPPGGGEREEGVEGQQQQRHVCPMQQRPTTVTVEAATFHFWAALHTKTCPSCHARIQRDHGCAHMTCSRCSAYFCWRCKGFLHGAPNIGRPCVCDRIVGTVLYSGLVVVGLIGLPVIVTVCAIGSGPYLIYLYARRHETRAREHRANVLSSADIDDDTLCSDPTREATAVSVSLSTAAVLDNAVDLNRQRPPPLFPHSLRPAHRIEADQPPPLDRRGLFSLRRSRRPS